MPGNYSLGQETEQIHKGTVSHWMVAMETDPLCTDARRVREEEEEEEGGHVMLKLRSLYFYLFEPAQ